MSKKIDRLGEIGYNSQGLQMKIVKYVNNKNIIVRFIDTGEEKTTTYIRFKRGMIKTDLSKLKIGGVGFKLSAYISLLVFVLAIISVVVFLIAILK